MWKLITCLIHVAIHQIKLLMVISVIGLVVFGARQGYNYVFLPVMCTCHLDYKAIDAPSPLQQAEEKAAKDQAQQKQAQTKLTSDQSLESAYVKEHIQVPATVTSDVAADQTALQGVSSLSATDTTAAIDLGAESGVAAEEVTVDIGADVVAEAEAILELATL